MRFTLPQVQEITGLSDRTLRRRIVKGELKAEIIKGKYYIDQDDLPPERLVTAELPFTDHIEEVPALNPQISELLDKINGTFTIFSEQNTKIAEAYKQTVSPIVQTAIMPTADIDEMLKTVQTIVNNFIAMSQKNLLQSPLDVEQFEKVTAKLLTGTGMTDIEIKAIAKHTVASYIEAHKQPSLT